MPAEKNTVFKVNFFLNLLLNTPSVLNSSIDIPAKQQRQNGTKGKTQGEKKDRIPARAAPP